MGCVDRQEMMERAVVEFGSGKYPFTAEITEGRLVFQWDWKNANILGFGSITSEQASFRYVVELTDNGTWHGYDMDEETIKRAGFGGNYVKSGAFVGHEARFVKEWGVDKDEGFTSWGFSTGQVHKPVKEFFESQGWKYKEPGITWVTMEGAGARTYLLIGILFSIIGAAGLGLFSLYGLFIPALLPLIFLLLGIWAFRVGIGKGHVPVFSWKAGLITIGIFFAVAWGIVGVIALLIIKANGIM